PGRTAGPQLVGAAMLVTVDYVKARTGFKGMADDVLTAAIEDASNLVRAEVEPVLDDVDADSLEAAIAAATGTSGTTGAGVVRSVVVNMVRRGTRNPLGAVQETLGDYSRAMPTAGGIPTIY